MSRFAMATLDSTSTDSQIVAAYMDNASYSEDASETKATGFVTACRLLLLRRPKRVNHGGEEIELDMSLIQSEMQTAQHWINNASASSTRGSVTSASFEDFRA